MTDTKYVIIRYDTLQYWNNGTWVEDKWNAETLSISEAQKLYWDSKGIVDAEMGVEQIYA